MAKILVVSDDGEIVVEIVSIPDPTDDDEVIHAATCRACPWDSFVSDGAECVYESDAINEAMTHLDTHERVS